MNEFNNNSLELKVFESGLGKLRATFKDSKFLVCAADITSILGFKNGRDAMSRHCKKEDIVKILVSTNSWKQNISFLNENAILSLLDKSKIENKDDIESWLVKEGIINNTDIEIDKHGVLKEDSNILDFCSMPVDIIEENGNVYFKLTDIERVLELSEGQSAKWLKSGWFDDDEIKLRFSQLGRHPLKYVAESGLYRILNRSNSSKAKTFERWVTKEVLPSIRKNGGYIMNQENMATEEILARAVILANNLIAEKNKIINEQKQVIVYQGEKVDNYDYAEKERRSKQELVTKFNKTVRLLAEQKFNRNYAAAYNYIYNEFDKLHCINETINLEFLKKNNDYLAECLKIATSELE